ncbi:MAG TPA: Fe-S cluster assembly protein SufD [Blastocatellia bacterium]|nr:Fe-S cluster assembly protein SufD [Blastocatellia bacterium]HMV86337.1 Fe-S cluster assembly protein SufD [Blastocatellia bacterium]HMX29097.1 Fe-S cluster assembly protein SufD [Blastocatellia bacterium]HMY74496.1 Fe-S cluster assembly protein SufD [Blastocatellia bacterium]HMZ17563.1 Fe-S cluster assembly protein SufD [Blastocatellia bacterium]
MPQAAKEKENYFSAYKLFAKTREGKDPAWLENLRGRAVDSFEALDFPTTRVEEWKYTNVAPILKTPFRQMFDLGVHAVTPERLEPYLCAEATGSRLVFINGLFSRQLSDLSELPESAVVCNLAEVPAEFAKVVSEHLGVYADYRDQIFTALNTAVLGDGAFVYIPKGKAVETPIHLLFISTASEPTVSHPRTLIVAGEAAIATVIESYISLGEDTYFTNAVTEVFAAPGAKLDHYRLQEESERAFHIATTQVQQERGSNYTSYAISLGGQIARHNLNVALTDEAIETTIDGLYVVTGNQHTDNHTVIDHQKPHCASHQLYKGILDGRGRAVFNGKVFVREGALLTDARQLNKNLLLSPEAHVGTKPELEIFADDVKCSHGATVGQLEDEELFYLASRGLSADKARALLTYGFAEDVISKIKSKSVREQLDRMVLDKLHQSLEVNQ